LYSRILLFTLFSAGAFAQSSSWTSSDKLVLTEFFYWYDSHTGSALHYADGRDRQSLHPPAAYAASYSYKDSVFFQRELSDMTAAGIDVVLPVYWGDPASVSLWSVPGLQVMVQAQQTMEQTGQKAPKIGMFADLTSLAVRNQGVKPDLTTTAGKSVLYSDIHNFFSLIPRRFWATIDNRPIVTTYVSNEVGSYDQSTFDYIAQQFQTDFGVTPYMIRHSSFSGVRSDAAYRGWPPWQNSAFSGDVASVSPGENNYAGIAEEGSHYLVDRNCGDYYRNSWERVIAHGARLVVVEDWNELLEGEGISASLEYGRRYIDITAQETARWKATPPSASTVALPWASLGPNTYQAGLQPVYGFGKSDGVWQTTRVGGRDAMYADRSVNALTSTSPRTKASFRPLPRQSGSRWNTWIAARRLGGSTTMADPDPSPPRAAF